MRADLHVHTYYSGMCDMLGLQSICRESYSHPEAVYHKLKRLGMDLVTVTDHDSIEVGESLRRYPDFFLSEEVTCRMPSGSELHVGVYDLSNGNISKSSEGATICLGCWPISMNRAFSTA